MAFTCINKTLTDFKHSSDKKGNMYMYSDAVGLKI